MTQHHDPVHPDSDHLTAELLADLDEGLLDAPSAEHARHHLTHCAACRQLHDLVHGVSQTLASLPTVPMPPDVEARLLTALAGEPSAPPVTGSVTPLSQAPSRRTGSLVGRSLGVAASVAAVFLVGGLAFSAFLSGDETVGPTRAEGGAATSGPAEAIQLASYSATATGTEYDRKSLDEQVDQLIVAEPAVASTAEATAPEIATVPPTSPDDPSAEATPTGVTSTMPTGDLGKEFREAMQAGVATSPEAARACIQQELFAEDVAPLAIDLGTFDDRPAAIIVLPVGDEGTRAAVWVIDPECPQTDMVLYYAQIVVS